MYNNNYFELDKYKKKKLINIYSITNFTDAFLEYIPLLITYGNFYNKKYGLNWYQILVIGFKSLSKGIPEWEDLPEGKQNLFEFLLSGLKNDFDIAMGIETDTYNISIMYSEININSNILNKKFSQREQNIFYRYFGLNDHKKDSLRDIAKNYKNTPKTIKKEIENILYTFRFNKEMSYLIPIIRRCHAYWLLYEYIIHPKNEKIEDYLIRDNIFILIEDLTRWADLKIFDQYLNEAFSEIENGYPKGQYKVEIIKQCLVSNESISFYIQNKSNRELIKNFLGKMYPFESFKNKTSTEIYSKMKELGYFYNKKK